MARCFRHLAVALVCWAGLALVDGADAAGAPSAELRCWVGPEGRLYTNVAINGEGPFVFIVDTAATVTSLLSPLADRFGLAPLTPEERRKLGETERVTYTLLGRDTYQPYKIDSLGLGAVRRTDVTVVVLPGKGSATAKVGPDGILGLDVLTDYFLLFDLREGEGRLLLFPRGAPPPEVEGWGRATLHARHVREIDTELWFVSARLGYRAKSYPIRALLDLGSGASVVNLSTMQQIGLRRAVERERAKIGDPRGRIRTTFLIKGLPVRVAGETVRTDVLGGNLPIFDLLGYDRRPAGIVGADVFLGRAFAVDFAGQRLLVAPDAD